MAMEGSSEGIEAQPSVRIELLKLLTLLKLTPRVQTNQTVSGDRFLDGQFILETQTLFFPALRLFKNSSLSCKIYGKDSVDATWT
jgi:hypothetical protein